MLKLRWLLLPLIFGCLPTAAEVELHLTGQWVQGGLILGKTLPGTRVVLDGTPVRVSDQGDFLLGFGRDHPQKSQLELSYQNGIKELRQLEIKKREYQIQRIDGLPKRKVAPEPIDYDRIRRDSAAARQALPARRAADGDPADVGRAAHSRQELTGAPASAARSGCSRSRWP